MSDFLLRTTIAGISVALICAPLGCLVLWRRMVYAGSALSHTTLLGIALGYFFHFNITFSIWIACLIASLGLHFMQKEGPLHYDALLGIISHFALALGIVIISFMPTLQANLFSYLFGDILSVGWPDIYLILVVGTAILALMFFFWNDILSITVQKEIAVIEGCSYNLTHLIFLLMLCTAIAITIQIIGTLLVISLLIIPAATSRYIAKSPEGMAIYAALFGVLGVLSGIIISLITDIPTGPSIVLCLGAFFFVLALLFHRKV